MERFSQSLDKKKLVQRRNPADQSVQEPLIRITQPLVPTAQPSPSEFCVISHFGSGMRHIVLRSRAKPEVFDCAPPALNFPGRRGKPTVRPSRPQRTIKNGTQSRRIAITYLPGMGLRPRKKRPRINHFRGWVPLSGSEWVFHWGEMFLWSWEMKINL